MSTSRPWTAVSRWCSGEGEIRASRAEVDDAERAVRKRGQNVVDELEEAVDLAVLVLALRAHGAVLRHHAELDEERDRGPFGEQPLLAAVVFARRVARLGGRRRIRGRPSRPRAPGSRRRSSAAAPAGRRPPRRS